jgi:hypothetical protein
MQSDTGSLVGLGRVRNLGGREAVGSGVAAVEIFAFLPSVF